MIKKGVARVCINVGVIFWRQGDYPKAISYYHKALKINEELNDKKEIAKCINNIGIIYVNQGDYSKALEYIKRALIINEEIGDMEEVAKCLLNIGAIYYYTEDLTQALEYWNKSLKIFENLGNIRNVSQLLTNIGVIYFDQEDYSRSAEYYENALRISEKIDDKSTISLSYQNLSSVYLKSENYIKALKYANVALDIADEIGELKRKMEIYNLFYLIYEEKAEYKNALGNHVLYKLYTDSLLNENNIAEITSLENQYEFDKEKLAIELEQQNKDAIQAEEAKRKEVVRNYLIAGIGLMVLLILVVLRSFLQKRKANKILAGQKAEIEEKNIKLNELDKFKEDMTGMIVHDLKNPLNSIIGLSENNIVKQSSKEMLNMVTNILDVHKYEDAEIKLSISNNSIYEISKTAIQQVDFLCGQKNIKLDNRIRNYFVNVEKEIIERVIVNILTNAIKYTPNNGKIVLGSIEKPNKFISISVADTGQGIPADKLDSVFGKFGQVVAKKSGMARSTGIGLTFCKIFVEAHGGKIGVESEVGKGTTFWFTLPTGIQENTDLKVEESDVAEKTIELTQDDKEILLPFGQKFLELEVFEYSEIEYIIGKIDFSSSQTLTKWKKEMDNALYGMNQEKYLLLVGMID